MPLLPLFRKLPWKAVSLSDLICIWNWLLAYDRHMRTEDMMAYPGCEALLARWLLTPVCWRGRSVFEYIIVF
ncbi:hypothetical protein BCR42DRAFT_418851 [Absidia repens]|uniref:Uncharacterized protein n=1 Tax=Absidia repens TaxID=90262 RepID=A0A1X2IC58_9FUNG|nr:hypothetical protein BCR42DRAFT_418851 [Absidia repens]